MEPTYKIAQALHARRAAVGLKKYGQHLTADTPGCMLVHALEESTDKTNYLIAEIQRRQKLMKWLWIISEKGEQWSDWAHGWFEELGGEAALARYDEILGGAENATVAPDPRDEALRVAEEALESSRPYLGIVLDNGREWMNLENKLAISSDIEAIDAALAAIRGAR